MTTTRAGTATNEDANVSPNVSSTSANVGRYHSTKGLLSEASSTNLMFPSEAFDDALWVKSAATVTADATTAPDGTVSAEKVLDTAASAVHFVRRDFASVPADNSPAVCSVYAKAAERSWSVIELVKKSGATEFKFFNLSTCAVGTNGTATGAVGALSNGWCRIHASVSSVGTGATTPRCHYYVANADAASASYLGDGASGIFLWGAQSEALATSTSYIRTTSASVTRNADVSTVPTTGWPTTSGEVSFRFTPISASAPSSVGVLLDTRTTVSTNGVQFQRDTSNRLLFITYDGTAAQCQNQTAALTWSDNMLIEGRWTPTSCEVWVNGVQADSDPGTGSPASHSSAHIGNHFGNSFQANGWFNSICAGAANRCP